MKSFLSNIALVTFRKSKISVKYDKFIAIRKRLNHFYMKKRSTLIVDLNTTVEKL